MSFGSRISNPSSELVLSSSANGLFCIGKAVLQGAVVQPSGSATAGSPGRTRGYSVYRITHPSRIIPAIDMPLNKRVGIIAVSQPAANTWDITAYCGDSPDAYGFEVQSAVDVWAFGMPTSPPSGWGGAIFDGSGSAAYDLTKPYPLFPRAFAMFPSTGAAVSIPALTRPVVLGAPTSQVSSDDFMYANHWAAVYWRAMLERTSSTSAHATLTARQRYEYSAIESRDIGAEDYFDTNSFILEGALLP